MNLDLPPLPYAIDALEPYLSRRTMTAHHDHHHAAYIEKTRALTRRTRLETADLEEIVLDSSAQDMKLFNAAAQAWNHTFFWYSMRAGGGGAACGPAARAIAESFGSHSAFSQQFVATASDHFGSGWVWLVLEDRVLRIVSTGNAGTPMTQGQVPLLALDLWEHAYYLDYEHRRLDYITAFLAHLIDWDSVNRRLSMAALAHAAARERSSRMPRDVKAL
jgi:Fe-Mn family superoxide dismutase